MLKFFVLVLSTMFFTSCLMIHIVFCYLRINVHLLMSQHIMAMWTSSECYTNMVLHLTQRTRWVSWFFLLLWACSRDWEGYHNSTPFISAHARIWCEFVKWGVAAQHEASRIVKNASASQHCLWPPRIQEFLDSICWGDSYTTTRSRE